VSGSSIVNPKPIRDLKNKRVIYLPWDLPSGILSQSLKRKARAKKDLDFCSLYHLDGQSVVFGALGAAAAVLALETLGSLSRRFRIGDLVGISRAIADEGTSLHYFSRRRSFLPSPVLADELETAAGGLPKGIIVSTDAPYRETFSWLKKFRRRGAGLVDMETSAVFALAAFRGIKAASLQIVSDEIFSGRWKTGFSTGLLKECVREFFLPLLFGGGV
jgi:hypothetical protein